MGQSASVVLVVDNPIRHGLDGREPLCCLAGCALWCGAVLAGVAYFILTRALIAYHGRDSTLANALGRDFKGKVSLVFYGVAIPLSFVNSWFAGALYVLVVVMWLIPDRRIEKMLAP